MAVYHLDSDWKQACFFCMKRTSCRWLKPEVVSNRVWLRKGALHIIPLPSEQCPNIPEQPSVSEALALVQSDAETTASSKIQVGQPLPGKGEI